MAERKPNVIVRQAIKQPRTFQEIARITGYPEDTVSDILAALWDANEIRIDLESRRFIAA